jgi:hypothetical protein
MVQIDYQFLSFLITFVLGTLAHFGSVDGVGVEWQQQRQRQQQLERRR